MRVVVAGFGVQGRKRKLVAGQDCVAVVDPVHPDADFRDLQDVPLDRYDAVLACIPDAPKCEILNYCVVNRKHVLVEKPLWFEREDDLVALDHMAQDNGVVVYSAYNHRFEPHYVAMRDLIASGELGEIYSCRMFYGNGTACLVRESTWRDEGAGVLPDLGSHLLDTCRFWFGDVSANFAVSAANCFENRSPDHVIIANEAGKPRIELNPSTGGAPASAGLPGGSNAIVVGVWMLQPGEDVIVGRRLKEVLTSATNPGRAKA